MPESEQAQALNKEGKYEESFALFNKIKGKPEFKYDTLGTRILGGMYLSGKGTIKDSEEAVKWMKIAAANGSKKAQSVMGMLYYTGDGVEKDVKIAITYLMPAAEAGNDIAMLFLANIYSEGGKGVKTDAKESLKWLRAAANSGNALALVQMGLYFEVGLGVTMDKTEALKLYEKAANKGEVKGIVAMGRCNLKGIGTKIDENAALVWFQKAAENKDAQYHLGTMYREGWESQVADTIQAKKYFTQAAKQGHKDAQKALDEIDPVKIELAKKAAEEKKNQANVDALLKAANELKQAANTTNSNNQGNNTSEMSIEDVVSQLKREAVAKGFQSMTKEGKVSRGEYNISLSTFSEYMVILVLPYIAEGYTPKMIMTHTGPKPQDNYHYESDWGDVKQIGGHTVIKMTFDVPMGGGMTTNFEAKFTSEGYFMAIKEGSY